jgi:hypothetical protein
VAGCFSDTLLPSSKMIIIDRLPASTIPASNSIPPGTPASSPGIPDHTVDIPGCWEGVLGARPTSRVSRMERTRTWAQEVSRREKLCESDSQSESVNHWQGDCGYPSEDDGDSVSGTSCRFGPTYMC